MSQDRIRIKGARQNNLKGLDLDLPLHELIVVTGVSGSGKSSLAFDTLYAEGQRRYIETFSAYARQFLERMDRPRVDAIEGIPPAIAIDQTNPVRTSRSTVGTMTELNDHLKLLFARAARLHCRGCGREVRRDSPESALDWLTRHLDDGAKLMLTFPVRVPESFTEEEVLGFLNRQGYTRIHRRDGPDLEVIQDRTRLRGDNRSRLLEGLESALRFGGGRAAVYPLEAERDPGGDQRAPEPVRFSTDLHCPDCDIHYRDPVPNLFSFNSPVGACPTCRGFGRVMGIDWGLVVPDPTKTLTGGAIKPFQTDSYLDIQGDLMRFCRLRGVPVHIPWAELDPRQRDWVLEGEGEWEAGVWYGVRRFFDWLEAKSYKMHIRVLLSKYRSYDRCPDCGGARLKDEALGWRLGSRMEADAALAPAERFAPPAAAGAHADAFRGLPGLCVHDLTNLPLARLRGFIDGLRLPAPLDQAADLLLAEIRSRLRYLCEVGLGYLTLDRQSRTLSGGEVQRINLTTALGTSLVNTLFVLDEPSIGLHPRDTGRILEVLRRLRDAGNSLLVVEHDPQVMRAADRILDIGPGPGEAGGEIVGFDTPEALIRDGRSLTARYLRGELRVEFPAHDAGGPSPHPTARPAGEGQEMAIEVLGAAEHNLQDLDLRLPLNRLVCLTGVSGSGKSTLLDTVLHRALCKHFGRPTEPPGAHRGIRGADLIAEVELVDQSALGKTTRSNPASVVGALDPIRKAFAAAPLARERNYTPGTFSFNAGNGRCPACGGTGFEHVEMQFLADVYLRCPECDGSRYRTEVLEVKLPGADGQVLSMAGVLGLTVTEALGFFADTPEVGAGLRPLEDVGLGYLRLGQPVTTLSGGEAQRLKLAGHLARSAGKRKKKKGLLFLFDEPTTGLHFHDIARLLGAFRRLLDQGHSLVVIEHNLDLIRAADWLIDLGPEGGDGGGRLVCEGTPETLMACADSHTGRALRDYEAERGAVPGGEGEADRGRAPDRDESIRILNAREHNLKGIDIQIPRDRFTVITGISGSGKSTVAFDILFAEGQRRYLESLNAYARSIVQPATRPEVDAVLGIPPTVAIEQRTSRGGRKSTVATLTEIHHYLRLLYVKLGVQHCPDCRIAIQPQTPEAILAHLARDQRDQTLTLLAPLVVGRKGLYNELAAWAAARGFGHLRVDGTLTPTDAWPRLDRFREHQIDLPVGGVTVSPRAELELRRLLQRALDLGKGRVRVAVEGGGETLYSTERACPGCGRSFEEPDPRMFSYNSRQGWCPGCFGTGTALAGFDGEQTGEEARWQVDPERPEGVCPACQGRRLRPESLAVRFRDRDIGEVSALPVAEAAGWIDGLSLEGRELAIAGDLMAEIRGRLGFLASVGLPYLSLDRGAPTLSGGEAQRIRLAAQLGSNLQGVCYILDEPTIGLHPRDDLLLLDTLQRLQARGNTLVVVEHDEETIRRAEHLVDLGPRAGAEGGRVVAQGTVDQVMRSPESLTGRCLAEPLRHPLLPRRQVDADTSRLRIQGADLHNLRGLDIALPLGRLIAVTGVSGSGKSTLVREVLQPGLKALLAAGRSSNSGPLRGCRAITGFGALARVLEVDQTPIGKTPRSCPATYVGIFDPIRRLFAATPEARMRGFEAGRFSFNVRGGRCDACDGQGVQRVEMSFLPDVEVSCDACGGARYNGETLMARFKDQSIAQVLAMSVDEAVDFFAAHSPIHRALALLQDVGLGYLTLGQRSPTLSGGEAQRIKLVTELAKVRSDAPARRGGGKHTLYLLDEPTVGLHMADVERLIRVLHRLVDGGHTVLVIEHNLDIIAEADWVLDLGPEGGDGGGRLVAEGPPEAVAGAAGSHTGRFLKAFLAERGAGD